MFSPYILQHCYFTENVWWGLYQKLLEIQICCSNQVSLETFFFFLSVKIRGNTSSSTQPTSPRSIYWLCYRAQPGGEGVMLGHCLCPAVQGHPHPYSSVRGNMICSLCGQKPLGKLCLYLMLCTAEQTYVFTQTKNPTQTTTTHKQSNIKMP